MESCSVLILWISVKRFWTFVGYVLEGELVLLALYLCGYQDIVVKLFIGITGISANLGYLVLIFLFPFVLDYEEAVGFFIVHYLNCECSLGGWNGYIKHITHRVITINDCVCCSSLLEGLRMCDLRKVIPLWIGVFSKGKNGKNAGADFPLVLNGGAC